MTPSIYTKALQRNAEAHLNVNEKITYWKFPKTSNIT